LKQISTRVLPGRRNLALTFIVKTPVEPAVGDMTEAPASFDADMLYFRLTLRF